ncbi:MAG: sulfite exporter TauE/SafE family protein [Alphaproteobacteria bacterium]|nr:sulfite exporter TauE/SafE family protein [Alphaproteobacteria bacterium]MBM3952870.1 sulfite exporter TauE/SafE family protein [Rhodospirillales bacterium]
MESAFFLSLFIFLVGTFAAAFVTGLSGFAFGMVAAGIWVHALAPVEIAMLIVAYALLVQGYAVWKLRRAIKPERLWPFVAGSAVGIPAGVWVLDWAPAGHMRVFIGLLLIAFSLYNLARPKVPEARNAGPLADGGIGIVNGILGGATGLGGVVPTIWCGLRGWPRDEQRAVFQPTAVATFVMAILWFGGIGAIDAETVRLFVYGLPILALGTALGWRVYGKLDEAAFRKMVLILLLVSGIMLVVPMIL